VVTIINIIRLRLREFKNARFNGVGNSWRNSLLNVLAKHERRASRPLNHRSRNIGSILTNILVRMDPNSGRTSRK
jgi:hypothetical protein